MYLFTCLYILFNFVISSYNNSVMMAQLAVLRSKSEKRKKDELLTSFNVPCPHVSVKCWHKQRKPSSRTAGSKRYIKKGPSEYDESCYTLECLGVAGFTLLKLIWEMHRVKWWVGLYCPNYRSFCTEITASHCMKAHNLWKADHLAIVFMWRWKMSHLSKFCVYQAGLTQWKLSA